MSERKERIQTNWIVAECMDCPFIRQQGYTVGDFDAFSMARENMENLGDSHEEATGHTVTLFSRMDY